MFFNRLFHFLFGGRLSPFEESEGKRDEGKEITSNSVFSDECQLTTICFRSVGFLG